MQALVNIQRSTGYQPSSAVNNTMMGPSIHKPDFPFAKNLPLAGWMSMNHNVQAGYFSPSLI